MRKIIKENKKKDIRKYLFFVSFGVFLIGTVFLAIEGATLGSYVVSLEKEEAELVEQNRQLSDKILGTTSLSIIEKKEGELNFAKPEKVVYMGREEPIAKVP